eukprot:208231-Alexandrium_andersonii.AAC.1
MPSQSRYNMACNRGYSCLELELLVHWRAPCSGLRARAWKPGSDRFRRRGEDLAPDGTFAVAHK